MLLLMAAGDDFTVRSQARDASLEVALAGELDMNAAFKLESALDPALDAGDVISVVLDLADVEFVDSAGLGALLAIRERAQERGIDLALARPSDPVRRILDITGLGEVLGD